MPAFEPRPDPAALLDHVMAQDCARRVWNRMRHRAVDPWSRQEILFSVRNYEKEFDRGWRMREGDIQLGLRWLVAAGMIERVRPRFVKRGPFREHRSRAYYACKVKGSEPFPIDPHAARPIEMKGDHCTNCERFCMSSSYYCFGCGSRLRWLPLEARKNGERHG